MTTVLAHAKINLALVVGPSREGGKHEVATVLQRVALADRVGLEPAESLRVDGYDGDTIVAAALRTLAAAAEVEPRWHVEIEKAIPVAAGLGGGSADAAAALLLANDLLPTPLALDDLAAVAAGVGSDVPFFLRPEPQLGRGHGADLTTLDLPRDYHVVLVLPGGEVKESTAAVYGRFDGRDGQRGFAARVDELLAVLASVASADDLAGLPPNDLAGSQIAGELLELGAFRADVTGAGPCVYGLFVDQGAAETAAERLKAAGRTWVTTPC
jgi:4-diphosphocytidyl-2-C-methyl-D-erythritol kinase